MSFQIRDAGSYDELMAHIGSCDAYTDMLIANNGVMSSHDLVQKIKLARALGIDFDKTITRGDGMFDVIREELLTQEMAQRDEECARAYFSGAHQSHFECCQLLFGSVGRMIASDVNNDDFDRVLGGVAYRSGAIGLMRTFKDSGAFTCAVITFGFADWVERWFEHRCGLHIGSPWVNPISRHRIYGLRLRWNTEGNLAGHNPATVVTDYNKGLAFQTHCASCWVEPRDAMALGDSPITDIGMLREATECGGVGILLIPKTECAKMHADSRTGRALQEAFPSIAGFLYSDSLNPLVGIREG
jgi:phosphoserine phosphatase